MGVPNHLPFEAAFARFKELGAKEYDPITKRGETGFGTASVVAPFDNVLGDGLRARWPTMATPSAEWHRAKLVLWGRPCDLVANNKLDGGMAVHFTPGQLRDAAGLTQETYRHWKKALPPLYREAGHSPCFTAGDLLATAIVRLVVLDFGIRVGALAGLADALFYGCNERSWPALERSVLLIDLAREAIQLKPESSTLVFDDPAIVVPLRQIIDRLRRALLAGDDDGQEVLRFPPVAQPAADERRKASQ